MGQKIGNGARIKIGTFLYSNEVEIGENSIIGPFTFIKAKELHIGNNTSIKPLVIIKTLKITISNYVHLSPLCIINSESTVNSSLEIGDHSRIFPFCWLDTGEGISIGKHVGVGGHTLMFTHGVWSNFIDGGPISFGPIVIEDNVWLPWRVFILPNVTLGESTIVGANSLINKSFESNSLIGGSPAKLIKKIVYDKSKRKERFIKVLEDYSKYIHFKKGSKSELLDDQLIFTHFKIVFETTELKEGDLLILLENDAENLNYLLENKVSVLDYNKLRFYTNKNKNQEIKLFINFLRRYGVRLYIQN